MRVNRWLMTGLAVLSVVSVSGCTEGDKIQLAEIEALERRVDKQMRLVREQNEQINNNLTAFDGFILLAATFNNHVFHSFSWSSLHQMSRVYRKRTGKPG